MDVQTDTRCDLTDLYVRDCAHCRGIPDPPPTERRLGRWFAAAFPGHCTDCDDQFDTGDRIRADGESGYLATCCGEDQI